MKVKTFIPIHLFQFQEFVSNSTSSIILPSSPDLIENYPISFAEFVNVRGEGHKIIQKNTGRIIEARILLLQSIGVPGLCSGYSLVSFKKL